MENILLLFVLNLLINISFTFYFYSTQLKYSLKSGL